jgi:parallel beta helix pectate lyase-like protein
MLDYRLFLVTLAAASLTLATQSANAQATRTWVSGTGNDANPCSRTAPCKTFAGAISKTAAGGEISVLDPGGYGAVSITKSITIDGGGGQVASILASATQGIIVNAGANDVVTLRNIRINGVKGTPFPGLNGVRFLAGAALHIENCTIFGFSQNAIDVNVNTAAAVRVFVTDSVLSNNAGGLVAKNAGAGAVFLALQRTTMSQNSNFGVKMDGSGNGAVLAAVSDSHLAANGTGVLAQGGPAPAATIQLTRSTVVHSTSVGAQSMGLNAFVFVSNTLMSGNATAVQAVGAGSLQSYQNNAIDANFAPGAFTGTIVPE